MLSVVREGKTGADVSPQAHHKLPDVSSQLLRLSFLFSDFVTVQWMCRMKLDLWFLLHFLNYYLFYFWIDYSKKTESDSLI